MREASRVTIKAFIVCVPRVADNASGVTLLASNAEKLTVPVNIK